MTVTHKSPSALIAKKILLVESDHNIASSIADLFRQQGWEVVTAADAAMIQAVAKREAPDAIVLSGQLPGGSPEILLRRLRSSVHTAGIPVLAIVPASSKQSGELLDLGAVDVLTRPLDTAALCESLRKHLGQYLSVLEAPTEILSDANRLAALRETGLLDSPSHRTYDEITHLASQLLEAPVAMVSLIDQDRQFFKSQVGLPEPLASVRQTPLSHSFCQWVVAGHEELVVDDANKHKGLQTNPAVRDTGVTAYAGVPLSADSGVALGSFCVIDLKPHPWSGDDLETLRNLAKIVEANMMIDRASHSGRARVSYAACAGYVVKNAATILGRKNPLMREADRQILIDIIRQQGENLVKLDKASM